MWCSEQVGFAAWLLRTSCTIDDISLEIIAYMSTISSLEVKVLGEWLTI